MSCSTRWQVKLKQGGMVAATLVTLLGAMSGCGEGEHESTRGNLVGPQLVTAEVDQSIASVAQIQWVPAPLTSRTVTVTQRISAKMGGSITAGRHTVTFPKGALTLDTDITVVDRTGARGKVACDLYPEGLTFQTPVTLSTKFIDLTSPVNHQIFWIRDPGTSEETPVSLGGNTLLDGSGVTVNLTHFSRYSPGKAGW